MPRDIPFAASSHLKSAVYDDDTQALTIEFSDGGLYTYHAVSAATADGLSQAASAGQYLHSFIKNQHQFSKHS